MKIFISAARSREFFVNCVEELIDTEYTGKHTCKYLPWQPGSPRDKSLLDRIKSAITESELVLMDVTPERCVCSDIEKWITNQGVLIEYGIVVGEGMLQRLSLFCDNTVNRDRVHPAFHKTIEAYSTEDVGQLKDLLKRIIDDMETYIMDMDRDRERQLKAYELILKSSTR